MGRRRRKETAVEAGGTAVGGGNGENGEKEGKRRWEESERERAREFDEGSKRSEEMEGKEDEVLRRRSSLEA